MWGRNDRLVPIAFMKHVERTFPAARHLELDCGHVPQVERPLETHDAMRVVPQLSNSSTSCSAPSAVETGIGSASPPSR